MPKLKMKVRDVGDVGGIKKSLQGASSSGDYFLRIAADSDITVRFLTEPDGWKEAWLHYDPDRKTNRSVICVEDVCEYCADGDHPRKAWFASVLDVDNGAVRVLQMPATVVEGINTRFEKRDKTLLTRDYIITRTGAGMNDTSYDVDSGDLMKRNLRRYDDEMPDIMAMLETLLPGTDGDEYEEESERPKRRGTKPTVKPQRGKPARRQPEPDDDEDDDEYEDDEPEYAMPKRRKPIRSTTNDGRPVRKTPPRRRMMR